MRVCGDDNRLPQTLSFYFMSVTRGCFPLFGCKKNPDIPRENLCISEDGMLYDDSRRKFTIKRQVFFLIKSTDRLAFQFHHKVSPIGSFRKSILYCSSKSSSLWKIRMKKNRKMRFQIFARNSFEMLLFLKTATTSNGSPLAFTLLLLSMSIWTDLSYSKEQMEKKETKIRIHERRATKWEL